MHRPLNARAAQVGLSALSICLCLRQRMILSENSSMFRDRAYVSRHDFVESFRPSKVTYLDAHNELSLRRSAHVQCQMIRRYADRAAPAAALFARVVHGRCFIYENAAAQTAGFNDDPMIFIIATDDKTGRLLI